MTTDRWEGSDPGENCCAWWARGIVAFVLPFSRTITLGPGSPWPSSLGNELQDMIIGRKHGDIDLDVPGAAFTLCGPNYAATVPAFNDDWAFTGIAPPNDTIVCGLSLPVGTRINSLIWHYNKASVSSTMTMKLRKRNGTTSGDVDSLADGTSGASYTTATRAAASFSVVPNYEVAAGDVLQLRVQVGSASHRFSHVIVSIGKG